MPDWILHNMKKDEYGLYLLCETDVPWIEEPVRENQELRKYLSNLYLQELENNEFPYFVIKEKGPSRLKNAIKSVDHYFKNKLIPYEVNN